MSAKDGPHRGPTSQRNEPYTDPGWALRDIFLQTLMPSSDKVTLAIHYSQRCLSSDFDVTGDAIWQRSPIPGTGIVAAMSFLSKCVVTDVTDVMQQNILASDFQRQGLLPNTCWHPKSTTSCLIRRRNECSLPWSSVHWYQGLDLRINDGKNWGHSSSNPLHSNKGRRIVFKWERLGLHLWIIQVL